MALPDLARLDLGAPSVPTGMNRSRPETRALRKARLAPAHADPVDAVLSDDNLVREILDHIANDEPADACTAAIKWANMLSKALGSKFDEPKLWQALTERVFPEGKGYPIREDPNDPRRNFELICAKVHAYRMGTRRLWDHWMERHQRPYVLAYLPHEPQETYAYMYWIFREDHEIALKAIRLGGWRVMHELDTHLLWHDRAFVLKVVSSPGLGQYLRYFHNKYMSDREVVLAAVKNDSGRPPPDARLRVVPDQRSVLGAAKFEFRDDDELVLAAVTRNPLTLGEVQNWVTYNKPAQLAAVRGDWETLQWASMNWDVDVVAAALVQSFDALFFVDEIVLKNPEFKELMLTYLSGYQWYSVYKYGKPRNLDSPQETDRLPEEAAEVLRAIHIDLEAGVPNDPDDPNEYDSDWSVESFSR